MKNLIFIFSTPRSGSTLLQRILLKHPEIHSVSEPWLLLPLAYLLPTEKIVQAPYNHVEAQQAIADLIQHLPQKENDFHEEMAKFTLSVYRKICPKNAVYFLDKTPRYYSIIPLIAKMFPEAKFIFLFRHPLATLASVINTFGKGRLGYLHLTHTDLYSGPKMLINSWKTLKDRSVKVSYEELVKEPERTIHDILNYLELSPKGFAYENFGEEILVGKMGDKLGIQSYSKIEPKGIEKWKQSYNSRFRILFARKYLRSIGRDVLLDIGYSMDALVSELEELKNVRKLGLRDATDLARTSIYRHLTGSTAQRVIQKLLIPGCLTWKFRKGLKGL